MKRSFSIFLFCIVASALIAPPADAVVFFRDDFQSDPATLSGSEGAFDPVIGDGDVGGEWSMVEAADKPFIQVVNDDVPWSGVAGTNNYVAIERQDGHMDARLKAQGWDAETLRDQVVELNFSIYVPSAQPSAVAFQGWDDSGWEEPWWEGRAFDIYFYPDGYVWYYDGANWPMLPSNKLFAYTQDAWQEVKMVADMSLGIYSITVEGNTQYGLTWAGGIDTIQSVTFMSDSNNTKFCIDNVDIKTYSPTPTLPGDANKDGTVNADDAVALAQNWLTTSEATWRMGDFNGDKKVDDIDAALMAANWGKTQVGTAAVPEPSCLALLMFAVLTGIIYAKSRC